jgi:predicted nucleic acid-binding protein
LQGTETLGRGEAEAIRLAKELNAALLLTDDRKARAAAVALGVSSIGLLAVVIQARKRGHIQSVRVLLDALETKGGLYLADDVKAEALKLADE